jgi:polyferredoxin
MATAPNILEFETFETRPPDRKEPRKKLVRRVARDRSQALRFSIQAVFLVLNLAIGLQFLLFVRYFETGGRSLRVERPAGVDGWLPIGGMMNLKYFLSTGTFPRVHPSAMVLLSAFLLISLLFRKAFCGWLCPVGTFSEALWKLGRKFLKANWRWPRWFDLLMRSLKYALLALFLTVIGCMSAEAIREFVESPYGMISDVKMLNFFRFLGATGAITLAVLFVLSMLVKNFWCRYLCPYGALMGLVSLLSPIRLRRDPERCIDCARCARACPALLPVDGLITVKSAECTACLECVAACPAEGALHLSMPGRRKVPAWVFAAGITGIFLGFVLLAKLTGIWQTHLTDAVYFQLVPRVQGFVHPGM